MNLIQKFIFICASLFLLTIQINGQDIIKETRSSGNTLFEAKQKAKVKAISFTLLDFGISKSELTDSTFKKISTDPDYFITSTSTIRENYNEKKKRYEVVISIKISRERIMNIKKEIQNETSKDFYKTGEE